MNLPLRLARTENKENPNSVQGASLFSVDIPTPVVPPWNAAATNIPDHYRPRLSPALVSEIVDRACLGFHVGMFVRLQNGTDCAFTELYPDRMIPVNGRTAASLAEVMTDGGPALAAHEIPLAISGVTDWDQLRAIRLLRGQAPEIIGMNILDREVTVTFPDTGGMYGRSIARVMRAIPELFPGKIARLEAGALYAELPELADHDRQFLQFLSLLAWRPQTPEPRSNRMSSKKPRIARQEHAQQDPEYGGLIQSVIVDVAAASAHLIGSGSPSRSVHSSNQLSKQSGISCQTNQVSGSEQSWREHVRLKIVDGSGAIESLRVISSKSHLALTALVTPGLPRPTLPYGHILSKAEQISVHSYAIESDSRVAQAAFECVPYDIPLTRIVVAPDGSATYIDLNGRVLDSVADEISETLRAVSQTEIVLQDTRFVPIDPIDPRASLITSLVPTGVGLRSIERCRCTNDLLLHSVRAIPYDVLDDLSRELQCSVRNNRLHISPPSSLKRLGQVLSRAPAIKRDLSLEVADPLREVTVLGAAGGIGGSSVALGNKILIDHGGFPENPSKAVDLSQTPWGKPSFVVVSHSHHDHSANAPILWKSVRETDPLAQTQFLMSEATAYTMVPVLDEQQQRSHGLIRRSDVVSLYNQIRPVPLHYPTHLSPSLSVTLLPAGHHIGSTMALFEHTGPESKRRVLYASDIKCYSDFGESRLYPEASAVRDIDALIIEGTNGVAQVAPLAEHERRLLEEILETVEENGTVILPVLAAGRAQSVMTLLKRNIHLFRERNVPILIDGPRIHEYNEIFNYLGEIHPDLFCIQDKSLRGWCASEPQTFNTAPPTWRKSMPSPGTPRVILVSGGMGSGPAADYIRAVARNPKDKIIFTCFQVPGSLGSKLLAFSQAPEKYPHRADFKAQIRSCRLSGHNSGKETEEFIRQSLKPGGTVVLLHGNPENLSDLKEAITARCDTGRVVIAQAGETIQLW